MSWLFASGGQSIGASASVLPKNIEGWFPLGCTGWTSLQSRGLSGVFSSTTVCKHQFFGSQLSLPSSSYPYMTTGKTIALTIWTFVGKVISLLFHTLSRLVTILTLSKLPSQPGYQPSQPPYLIIAPYLNGLNWVEDSSLSGWLTLKLFLEVKFIPREDTLANHSGCRV